jgi:MYXO-CTERM domain-containing protein
LFVSTGQRFTNTIYITKCEENFQMKNTLTLIAVAGLASVASAGSAPSLSIVPSATSIDSTAVTSFTLSVYGDSEFGTAISGGAFSMSATGGEIVTDMVGAAAAWGALGEMDLGHGGNGNYNGLVFGQLIFPPFIPAAEDSLLGANPVLLGVITVNIEANSAGVIDWTTGASDAGDFVLEIFTDDGGEGSFQQFTDVSHGSASVTVTPAPSALALLGLGGIAAGRRRR